MLASAVIASASRAGLIHSGDGATHHQDHVITPVSLSAMGMITAIAVRTSWARFQYRSAVDRGSFTRILTAILNTVPV